MQEIFAFEQTKLDERGAVRGRFRARGIRPKFMEKLEVMNIAVPPAIFDPGHATEL
jgi:pilus assembly protein CpaF